MTVLAPLLMILLLFAGPQTRAKSDYGSIEGSVLNSSTSAPIPNTEVLAVPEKPAAGTMLRAITDQDGHFAITNIRPGRYRVSTSRYGYYKSGEESERVIAVSKGEQIRDVRLSLKRSGTIYGTVFHPDNIPAAGISLELVGSLTWNGYRSLHSTQQTTKTDRNGEYRFLIAPGEYYVRTVSTETDRYARTYLPGTSVPAEAVSLRVVEGADVLADLHLTQARVFTISGRISYPSAPGPYKVWSLLLADRSAVRDDGIPPHDLPCVGCPLGEPTSNAPLTLSKDQFEIRGVRPGSYDLFTVIHTGDVPVLIAIGDPPPAVQPVFFKSRTPVEVTDHDVTGITVAPGHGIDVTGHVVSSGGRLSTNKATATAGARDNNPFSDTSAQVDRKGRFILRNLVEGTYALRFSLPSPDAFVVDVRQGGKSVRDSGLQITSAATEPLEVIVNPVGGIVTGVVENGRGAFVALSPVGKEVPRNSFQGIVRTGRSGEFTFRGIPPGDYRVFAFAEEDWPRVSSRPDDPRGTPVTVTLGTPLKISIPVINP